MLLLQVLKKDPTVIDKYFDARIWSFFIFSDTETLLVHFFSQSAFSYALNFFLS